MSAQTLCGSVECLSSGSNDFISKLKLTYQLRFVKCVQSPWGEVMLQQWLGAGDFFSLEEVNSMEGGNAWVPLPGKHGDVEAVSCPLGRGPADLHHGKLHGEGQCLQRAHTERKVPSSGS